MIEADLMTAAHWTGGQLAGRVAGTTAFRGLSTDTRQLRAGELFVALEGPNFAGDAFLSEAAGAGAAAAVVPRGRANDDVACIEVADTLDALGALAAAWRERFSLPVVAVTGSNGKTTVKECIASIMRQRGCALVSKGNWNNRVGVPLTLAELEADHDSAVLELASNCPGEIATLARLVRPGVGVITNGHPAHLAGFGTAEAVARANGELFAGFDGDAVAVLPADDPWFAEWCAAAGSRRVVTFATEATAHVTVSLADGQTVLAIDGVEAALAWPLVGEHNRRNAAAAAAAAWAAGFGHESIIAGLEGVAPVAGRLVERRGTRGSTVFDDSYNANPGSFDAALAVLACAPGRRWAVVGEMAELGSAATEAHRDLGRRARAAGIDRLWALGPHAASTCAGFGEGALAAHDRAALARTLAASVDSDVSLLVKGSRSNKLEQVVEAVIAPTDGEAGACCSS